MTEEHFINAWSPNSLKDPYPHYWFKLDLIKLEHQIKAEEREKVIEECADKFAEILSNMTQICGVNCPIKCNWGTEDTCEEMCKKWFIEQVKES